MSLAQNSLVLFFATAVSTVISYFYNPLLLAPKLGAEGIAVLGASISVYTALSFLQRPVALTVTRYVSQYQAEKDPGAIATLITKSLVTLFKYGIGISLPLFLLSPLASKFLNLNSSAPVIAAILFVCIGLLQTAVFSAFQGMLRFRSYSVLIIADPVLRLITGGVLLQYGFGISAAWAGYIAGCAGSLLLGCWFLKGFLFCKEKKPVDSCGMFQYGIPALAISVHSALVISIDIFIVKHFFPDFHAGIYIAASTLAKLMLVAVAPLYITSFSHMSDASSRNQSAKIILGKTLLAAGGLSLFLTLLFYRLAPRIVGWTYGSGFEEAVPLLGYSCLALIPVILTVIYTQYCLAIKKYSFLWGLIAGAILRVGLLLAFHGDLYQIISASLAGGIAEFLFSLLTGISALTSRQEKTSDRSEA